MRSKKLPREEKQRYTRERIKISLSSYSAVPDLFNSSVICSVSKCLAKLDIDLFPFR